VTVVIAATEMEERSRDEHHCELRCHIHTSRRIQGTASDRRVPETHEAEQRIRSALRIELSVAATTEGHESCIRVAL